MAARMVEAGRELVEAGRAWQWELPTVLQKAIRRERRRDLPMVRWTVQLMAGRRESGRVSHGGGGLEAGGTRSCCG